MYRSDVPISGHFPVATRSFHYRGAGLAIFDYPRRHAWISYRVNLLTTRDIGRDLDIKGV